MVILVSGGAGYIGSHTCVELLNAGHDIIVADNYCNACPSVLNRVQEITGRDFPAYHADMSTRIDVERIFSEHPDISAVIQFAAYKSISESYQKPIEYYANNINTTLNILEVMRRYDCHNLVFSSSAAVYGHPLSIPVTEETPIGNCNSPYGMSKAFTEYILKDCCRADSKLNVAILRYFNPIGAHPSGMIGENLAENSNNLFPCIAKVAVGKQEMLRIYGSDYSTVDGTGVRDYIHVVDLAKGHLSAIEKLLQKPGLVTYNLGTGKGYSVLEVLHAFENECGHKLPYSFDSRRQGDIAVCWADASKAKEELDWVAQYGLSEMCRDAWNWYKNNPDGYPK